MTPPMTMPRVSARGGSSRTGVSDTPDSSCPPAQIQPPALWPHQTAALTATHAAINRGLAAGPVNQRPGHFHTDRKTGAEHWASHLYNVYVQFVIRSVIAMDHSRKQAIFNDGCLYSLGKILIRNIRRAPRRCCASTLGRDGHCMRVPLDSGNRPHGHCLLLGGRRASAQAVD